MCECSTWLWAFVAAAALWGCAGEIQTGGPADGGVSDAMNADGGSDVQRSDLAVVDAAAEDAGVDLPLPEDAAGDDATSPADAAEVDAETDLSTDAADPQDLAEGDVAQDASTEPDSGVEAVWGNGPDCPAGRSRLEVSVDIPAYDSSDPEHFLIANDADWSHINDPDKRRFYVAPNTAPVDVVITASGTAARPRTLALNNTSGLHPAQLSAAEQARVHLTFDNAAHWIVDRLSSLDDDVNRYPVRIAPTSHDLIINRMNFAGFRSAILVEGNNDDVVFTHAITIQGCRMDPMNPAGLDGDAVAILLSGSPWDEDHHLEDVQILNNEIRNCNDGVMPIRHPELDGGHHVNYPGVVMDCNHIYVDTAVYTDGAGNPYPHADADWAWTENAIDLKGGSDNPAKPMVISNNTLWGYRHTDTNGGGSGSWGTAAGGHYHVKNVIFRNNLIFDSNRAISFGDPHGLPYSVEDALIEGNIFYDIGKRSGENEYAQYYYWSKGVTFSHNTIVGVGHTSRWLSNDNNETDMEISCNAVIDANPMTGTRAPTTVVSNNYLYATPAQEDTDGTLYPDVANAHMTDLTFTTDTFTNEPRQITLPGVLLTADSPHRTWCQ